MTTTIRSEGHDPGARIRDLAGIVALLEDYSKNSADFRIGIEYERLPIRKRDGTALPYIDGVEKILDSLAEHEGWERGFENGRIVYLRKGDDFITLEPGGQTEYSSAPSATIGGLFRAMLPVIESLDRAAAEQDAVLLGLGYQPFVGREAIEWVPKTRYEFMAPFLKDRGDLAHEMMKMTAGMQVALDYSDGRDAMRKLVAASLCTPVAQALFAASGIGKGRKLDYLCWRGHIWTRTDSSRCDVPGFMLDPEASLDEYANWLADMPLMFLEREGIYRDSGGISLRTLIARGEATIYDVELALTQAFPEVRLKHFVEIRSVDTPQPWLAATIPCFWSSLLYGNLDGIFALFGRIREAEFAQFRESAMRSGLKGEFRGRAIADWARDLLDVASENSTCGESMELLRKRVESAKTPAEAARDLLDKAASPARFVTEWNAHRW